MLELQENARISRKYLLYLTTPLKAMVWDDDMVQDGLGQSAESAMVGVKNCTLGDHPLATFFVFVISYVWIIP